MQSLTLNNGVIMPQLGFGVFQVPDPQECESAVAEGRNGLFEHPVLKTLGAKHGRTVAQVLLRWLLQRGVVAIPKSVRPERIAENLRVFDFELETADMEAILALDTRASVFFDHRDPEVVAWIGGMGRES